MKVSVDFGRWTRTKAALAVAGTLVLGGVVGSALAISPTVDSGLVFQGGVNINQFTVEPTANRLAYTVPAGKRFMLTDIAISGSSKTNPAELQYVFTGGGASCTPVTANRTSFLNVPAGDTLHLPFVTGIGFAAGQFVCLSNGDDTVTTHWTIRGFLF